jgi:hypothetical protein
MNETPLFIPLMAEHFDAFDRGVKRTEYRAYTTRWNERTCRVGRAVLLSYGYGKHRRIRGVVTRFRRLPRSSVSQAARLIYPRQRWFAAITIDCVTCP